jgi:hypothetical protein
LKLPRCDVQVLKQIASVQNAMPVLLGLLESCEKLLQRQLVKVEVAHAVTGASPFNSTCWLLLHPEELRNLDKKVSGVLCNKSTKLCVVFCWFSEPHVLRFPVLQEAVPKTSMYCYCRSYSYGTAAGEAKIIVKATMVKSCVNYLTAAYLQ